MKTLILAAISLGMLTSTSALAQRNHHHQPSARYESQNPVNRALRDLQMIYSRANVDRHESEHFRRAIHELNEFQRRAADGRFDYGRLDRAIDNMADLAKADQLHPRHRSMLREDLFELRNFRSYAGRRGPRW